MSLDSFLNEELCDLNDGNYVLDLLTGTRLYVRSRLYDRGRKVRSYMPFFRPDGILPANGFTREKVEPIPIGEIA